ncbi:MAG: sensor histidine kinase [Rhodospirillales bacterium]|nr:sensor histidine kinase [Rhodospirillales bacterium]
MLPVGRHFWGPAGTASLRENVLSMAAGTIGAWWTGRLSVFWRAQIVGWSLFFLVELLNRLLTYRSVKVAVGITLVVTPCLVVLSAGMRSVYTSRAFNNRLTPHSITLIGVLSVAAAVAVAIVFVFRRTFGWEVPFWGPIEEVVVPWIHYSLALAGWSLCYFWIHAEMAEQAEHQHAVRAEAEALRLELEELRLQLDPHFLFNALNGVAEEIPEHPSAALAMLRNLTAYLRNSLDGINQTIVTVDTEVGGLSAYLGVQKARFGDRLRTHIHVEHAAGGRQIASFLLQPLVENAVKYGRREDGLDIHIDIRAEGDTLHVEIENTGALEEGAGSRRRRPGIGLENVRRRLDLHYPGRHEFTIGDGGNKVVARLTLEGEPCSGS